MPDMTQVPTPLWDEFQAWFKNVLKRGKDETVAAPPPADPPPPAVPDEFTARLQAATAEAEKFKTELEQLKAVEAQKARVAHFGAEIAKTKATRDGLPELLAALPDATAERILREFAALSAQIKESNLTTERGSEATTEATGNDPRAAFDTAVKARMAEKGVNYADAYSALKTEKPELFSAAFAEKKE